MRILIWEIPIEENDKPLSVITTDSFKEAIEMAKKAYPDKKMYLSADGGTSGGYVNAD